MCLLGIVLIVRVDLNWEYESTRVRLNGNSKKKKRQCLVVQCLLARQNNWGGIEIMGKDLLYWFGAGASFNALPVIANFEERLKEFLNTLKAFQEPFQIDDEGTAIFREGVEAAKRNNIHEMQQDLEWTLEHLKEHASIDTFAKKLWFQQDSVNLHRLKSVISCFLVHEQISRPVDYRYDSFFASILKNEGDVSLKLSIPEDIKFLTWNYDLQLEKAYYNYIMETDRVKSDLLLSNPKRLYHINGYCGTTEPGHVGNEIEAAFKTNESKDDKFVWSLYASYHHKPGAKPDINFAWESNENLFESRIGPITKNIGTVIVIGYSFPFFNREIDKKIFQALGRIDRIFVQTPPDAFEGIRERIRTIWPNLPEPYPIADLTQFFIPFDYNLK